LPSNPTRFIHISDPYGFIKMTQSAVVLENLIGQFLYNKAAESGDAKK